MIDLSCSNENEDHFPKYAIGHAVVVVCAVLEVQIVWPTEQDFRQRNFANS